MIQLTPRPVRSFLASLVVAAALVSTPLVTLAASPAAATGSATPTSPRATSSAASLAAVKARCATAISDRQTTLTKDVARLAADTTLRSTDRSALSAELTSAQGGLTTLGETIAADTTLTSLRADCKQIVTGFRVYVVIEPALHIVIATDQMTDVDSRLAAEIPKLVALEAAHPQITAAVNDLSTQTTTATATLAPVVASVISLTAADYPGSTATLQTALAAVHSARADLAKAHADIVSIRAALASGHPAPATTSPAA